MNVIKHFLGRSLQAVHIYVIGDAHLGSKEHRIDEFQETIERVRTEPDTYAILNGDLINNALPASKSDPFEEQLSPEGQISRLRDLLEPIKDRILGIIEGNHERRTYRSTGLNPTRILARELGIEHLYDPTGNVIFINFGKTPTCRSGFTFTIYQVHGTGGGRTVGSKMNNLHRMAGVINADVYVHGHTHMPAIFKENYCLTDTRSKSVRETERLFVNSNAYQAYGGYGQEKIYTPANRNPIKITLWYDPKYKRTSASL